MIETDTIEEQTENSLEKERNYYDKVLAVAIEIGCGLLGSGCPVGRVEIAVDYVCRAYGAAEVNVSTFPSMIMAGVRLADGSEVSQLKRVHSISNNFSKMEAYNQLSRDICKNKYPLEKSEELVKELRTKHNQGKIITALSGGIGAGAFTVFYGGSLIDAVPAAFIGGLMAYLSCVFAGLAFNGYARTFMLSLTGGILCTVFCWLIRLTGLHCTLSTVMMGTIMIVIPGLLMCNAIRDLFSGDTYSGTSELLTAIITTLAIVAGYGVPMVVLKVIVDNSEPIARSGMLADYLYRIIACFIGTAAFTLFFGGSFKKLIPSSVNAMVTFGVYLLMEAFVGNEFLDVLVATLVAATLSEIFARTLKAPAIIFFVPGIIIFVPGRSLYLAVSNLISGNAAEALVWGKSMGNILLGIVVGLIIITLFFQLLSPTLYRKYVLRKMHGDKADKKKDRKKDGKKKDAQ